MTQGLDGTSSSNPSNVPARLYHPRPIQGDPPRPRTERDIGRDRSNGDREVLREGGVPDLPAAPTARLPSSGSRREGSRCGGKLLRRADVKCNEFLQNGCARM